MISPDYWCAAVLAAISVMMFEDLNVVFVTEDTCFDSFSWAERCSVSDSISLMQHEPINRFFIIDGKVLEQYEKTQIRQLLGEEDNLRTLIIDAPENELQWEGDKIVVEHTVLQKNEFPFSSFLLSALEDDEVKESLRRDEWQELSEYFIETRNLGIIKKFVDIIGYPENKRPIMPGTSSLLRIAINSNHDSMDEIVSFLLGLGDVYRTSAFIDDRESEEFGLAELASDTMDAKSFTTICWLLENGYRAETRELFYIAISFLRYTTECKESGRYLPHLPRKSDQNKWLEDAEEKFCSEFKKLAAFFPEDVFSYRDAHGKTLLMYASEILYGRFFLPELYKTILGLTKDPWLIDDDGNNALYYLSIYSAGEEVFELFRNSDVQFFKINRNGNFCTTHFYREFQERIENKVGHGLYESIPAVVDALCFADGYRREVFKDILKKLLKDCDALQKAVFVKDGSNALMHLISYRYDPELFDDILKAGIDINATDWAGDTALMYAIYAYWDNRKNNKKLSFLINHGIDVAIQNKIGETAVHVAARSFRFDEEAWNIIGTIKDKKAFLLSNNYGFTPVMTAFKYMNMSAIRFLVNNGYVQNTDMEYIRKQIDRVNTKSMREELENLYSSTVKNGGRK